MANFNKKALLSWFSGFISKPELPISGFNRKIGNWFKGHKIKPSLKKINDDLVFFQVFLGEEEDSTSVVIRFCGWDIPLLHVQTNRSTVMSARQVAAKTARLMTLELARITKFLDES